jgi:hypothetical protein
MTFFIFPPHFEEEITPKMQQNIMLHSGMIQGQATGMHGTLDFLK